MFEKIDIKNFKCFGETSIKLTTLNILTGQNSSGKSSIIQAMLLLLQSIENAKGNILNGRYTKLGYYSDVKNIFTREAIEIEAVMNDNSKAKLQIRGDGEVELNKSKEFENDIIYLSADRIGVKNEYDRNEEEIDRIGLHGEYAFDYLSKNKMENIKELDFIKDPTSGKNLGNQVDYWLEYFTGYSVKAEAVEGTSIVKVAYKAENSPKELRTIHVGTGVSYLATIIIAALSCTKKSLLIIENPEIHLHPGAQSKFTELFTFLSSRGLQIVIETHSDHIINGIRKEIKKQAISLENVSIYYMSKNEKLAYPEKINISENGAIINYKKGFFDQFDDDLDILLGLDEYE